MLTPPWPARSVFAVMAALLAGMVATATPAHAAGICGRRVCTVDVTAPGAPSKTLPGGPIAAGGRGLGHRGAGAVYVPPPTPLDPRINGQQVLLSTWTCVGWVGNGAPQLVCPKPPPGAPVAGAALPVLTAGQVAAQARAQLQLTAPAIEMVPKMGAGRMGLVGVPVWMWTPAAQWRPLTATAAAGGLQVTAVARIARIDWVMGDGSTVHCTGPGTPYEETVRMLPSPDCGHVYRRPSGNLPHQSYVVTATAVWDVTWFGAETGAQQVPMTATTTLTIGEVQVLVTG